MVTIVNGTQRSKQAPFDIVELYPRTQICVAIKGAAHTQA